MLPVAHKNNNYRHRHSGRHVTCSWLYLILGCALISSFQSNQQLLANGDESGTFAETTAPSTLIDYQDQASGRDNDHEPNGAKQITSTNNNNDDDGGEYLVGAGIADITGPAAEINLMGYAKTNQDSGGIHLRQFARSIVIEDKHGQRIVYSNLDNGMISQLLRSRVLARLRQQFGGQMYNESNVMMSATHSHSCPGGFFQYMLYNIPSAGFIQQTLDGLVDGVVRSIERAHESMVAARIYLNKGDLLDASVNRSPVSYANNPAEERARYEHNTDKQMVVLRFVEAASGQPLAMLSWFAVHGTSMNNTNHLISSDNKGYAALLMEADFSPANTLPGRGKFVAIFAQANEGDVSPNTRGARCTDTGLPCDLISSTCGTPPRNDKCVASGPGRDMFESTKIIAYKQYHRARELFLDGRGQRPVRGPVRYVHEHIDMTQQRVPVYQSAQQQQQQLATFETAANSTSAAHYYRTCAAALGYSFAAGTTDGSGAFDFQQGDTASSRYWNIMRDFLKKPSAELQRCQQPKPILLATGEMDFPYMWHPRIIPTQIFLLGQVAIVGLPGEFTTMSGRRVRDSVRAALTGQAQAQAAAAAAAAAPSDQPAAQETQQQQQQARRRPGATLLDDQVKLLLGSSGAHAHDDQGPGASTSTLANPETSANVDNFEVVLSGLSNVYSSYVATLEEYQIQRYEGASTLYGPHTLQAYVNQFVKLARRLAGGQEPPADAPDSLQPPDLSKSLFTLKAGVIFDGSPHGKSFGSVLEDVDPAQVYACQQQVSVSFVAGNPRNDLRQEQSFLYVDKLESPSAQMAAAAWLPIASDASWETQFLWERTNSLFGESKAIVKWDIPHDCRPGVYRIRHLGAHKNLLQTISQYSGQSSPFKVAGGATGEPIDNSTLVELDRLMQLALQLNQNEANQRKQELSNQVEGSRARAKADASQTNDRQPGSLLAAPLRWFTSLFRARG